MMRRKKKGQAQLMVWFLALLFLFMIALVYIIMTKPFILVRDKFEQNFTGTEFQATFDKINTFWTVWPILVIVGVIIWAFVSTSSTNQNFPRL